MKMYKHVELNYSVSAYVTSLSLKMATLHSLQFSIIHANICNFLIFHSILIEFGGNCMDYLGLAFQTHLLSMLHTTAIQLFRWGHI